MKCRRTGPRDGTVGREHVGQKNRIGIIMVENTEFPKIAERCFNRSFKSRKLSSK